METLGPVIVVMFFAAMLTFIIVLWVKILFNDTNKELKDLANKPGTICFFCGAPVTGTTHFDRWHSKTRRRLPSVYVCDECFDKHPKIPEA